MEAFDIDSTPYDWTEINTPKSRELLDEHLRSYLDTITRIKTFRINTAEFLEKSGYVQLKQIAPNPQTGYNHGAIVHPPPATRNDLMTPEWTRFLPYFPVHLERSCYIKLKQIAPNPQTGFKHSSIVPPAPATREEMMTPAWSKYLPTLPKSKSAHGWTSFQLQEKEEVELREKSDIRNKIWYNLFYKKDYSKTENESFWFNVVKKHRWTKSLHDIVLTGRVGDDVTTYPATSSYSA
ncbi:uncharacterized protein LOC117336120 [Pecten maximus]|uniref:uncharacterized protein LOC117336120 n=1 Tax=Pecten maximus TaxID=6579 RepID=UPI001458DB7C|nr:uncharacterized protein LOC117336120 [Pecten maximus]